MAIERISFHRVLLSCMSKLAVILKKISYCQPLSAGGFDLTNGRKDGLKVRDGQRVGGEALRDWFHFGSNRRAANDENN